MKIGFLGAGKHAAEVKSYCRFEVGFFAVDVEYANFEGAVDIDKPTSHQIETPVVAAVGAPALKKQLTEKWTGSNYINVIAPNAYLGSSVEYSGLVMAPMTVMTNGAKVGRHVLVNVGATISHDSDIGDFATICPGVHIGGSVTIGNGAFIGIGATIRDGVHIADGAVIGAGAIVLKDADVENGVYVGSPARLIKVNEGWLNHV